MTAYIINENTSPSEIESLNVAVGDMPEIATWPLASARLPHGISVAILIVREHSSELEEERAMAVINAGIRIVCVFIEKISTLSLVAEKYCSTKVSLVGGGLVEALKGSDEVQDDAEGKPAPRNPQRPHNC